jgi:L-cysteine desulfidase
MSNKQDWMLERLNRLVKICKSTEPDNPDDTWLFTPQVIDAHEMYTKVNTSYDSLSHEEKVEIMKKANTVWKIRRKIWNGEWDDVSASTLHTEIEDMIKAGAIIEAIKHYRSEMKTSLNTDVSLKECKDYVDALREDLKRRGFKN